VRENEGIEEDAHTHPEIVITILAFPIRGHTEKNYLKVATRRGSRKGEMFKRARRRGREIVSHASNEKDLRESATMREPRVRRSFSHTYL